MIITTLQERKRIVQKFINTDLLKSFPKDEIGYYGVIYKIYNDVDDKVYIGKTRRFCSRAMEHVRAALDERYDERSSAYLYRSMREIGIEHFHMEIIDIAFSPEELSDKEVRTIVKYKSILPEYGYNTTVDRISYQYMSSRKRSKSHKGIYGTENGKRRRSNPLLAININERVVIYTESSQLFSRAVFNGSDRSMILYAAKYCRKIKGFYMLYMDYPRICEKHAMLKEKMNKCNRSDFKELASNYYHLYDILKRRDYDNFNDLFSIYQLIYDDTKSEGYTFENCEEIPC